MTKKEYTTEFKEQLIKECQEERTQGDGSVVQ